MLPIMKKNVLIGITTLFVVLITIFLMQQPSHDREWSEDVEHLPSVTIEGSEFTIDRIRDWKYDEEGVVEKDYREGRVYDISKIKNLWFYAAPFGNWEGIAHTFLVFEFDGEKGDPSRFLSLSIEARKESDESYSAFRGLFRNFELIYVWATERDLTTRRAFTQDVLMYKLNASNDVIQSVLRDLLEETNDIFKEPRWYNTLFNNCTNELVYSANRTNTGLFPLHYSRFFAGFADNFLFEQGYIETDITDFEQLEQQVNKKELLKKLNVEPQTISEKLRQ